MPGGPQVVAASYGPALLTSVRVGGGPSGLAYDSGKGEVFVSNYQNNNVSVISDSTDKVVANIGVGSNPWSVTYDSGQNEVYVGCYGSTNVSVISDQTDKVVASIGNYTGGGITYDPGTNEIFIGNITGGTVEVYSDTSYAKVATIPVGNTPAGGVYDPAKHEVFVANEFSGNISVINDTTDTVVASVPVGWEPGYLAYDPTQGEVFSANSFDGNVSAVSDGTNTVVATIGLHGGSQPDGIAFDSALDEVLVTNDASHNVSLVSALTNKVVGSIGVGAYPWDGAYDSQKREVFVANSGSSSASIIAATTANATFTVNTTLTASRNADTGQTVGIQGGGYGRGADVTTFDLGSYPVNCTTASVGSCTGGTLATNGSGSFDASFILPSVTVSGMYSLTVSDSSGYTATTAMVANPDPTVGTPEPSRDSVDVGQSVWFNTTATNGSGGYTFDWSGLPPGCSGALGSIACVASTLGNYTIQVDVTDSNGFTSPTSVAVPFQVAPPPSVTLTTAPSSQIDAGQTVTFGAQASSGLAPYVYSWTGLPTQCAPGNATTATCAFPTPGSFMVGVSVTDSNNDTMPSAEQIVRVAADPTVTLSVDHPSSDLGRSITFTATAESGSGGFTYAWTGLPNGCTGSGTAVSCIPPLPGSYNVTVRVTDATGLSAESPTLEIVVAPRLSVSASAGTASPVVGEVVNLTSTIVGGTGPYTTNWNFGDGSVSTGPSAAHAFRAVGTFEVSVWVNDSAGGSATKFDNVTVVNSPVPPTTIPPPSSPAANLLLIPGAIGAVIVVCALGALVYLRRRRQQRSADNSPSPRSSADLRTPEEPPGDLSASDGSPGFA
jgi:YVTN family beta-propeller protein